tara:strand:- start:67 stop:501 length:435 start_codon:yes stop_codon:yes gene_type:complete
MTETDEMKMCFDEMEKLKAKMEALEKQKNVDEEKRLLRELTMEPNLKVLKTWLDDYQSSLKKQTKDQLGQRTLYNVKNFSTRMSESDSGRPTGQYYNQPSEFMEKYIDSTYNMFNIINKRLDDIETKLSSNTTTTKKDFQPSGW